MSNCAKQNTNIFHAFLMLACNWFYWKDLKNFSHCEKKNDETRKLHAF